ncbi:TPA: restriction endonuclease subunit S [Photobacterium damselae]
MSVEFRTYLLSEIASKITKGTTPSKKDGGFSESGINYIKAESVGFDGRIDRSKFAFISEDVHHKLKRSQLEVNDILFSMAGVHLGKVALVEEQHVPANTNQALALIRPITSLVNPLYLLYFLQQREVVHFVNNATSQSAQPNINLKQIGDLEIRLPELAVQNKVVDILSSLDRKLVINTDINQNLENIAQAIFKSWFVDFEPVKAKMNGEQPEGMDAATASLFPEKLVDTEVGELPEGWKLVPVGELLDKTIGGDWGKEEPDEKHTEEVRIVRGTDIPKLHGGAIESVPVRYVESKKLKTRKLERGDIVIEVSGGSKDQPTGRSLFISDNILKRLELPSEPASFCRRFNPKSYEIGLLLAVHFQLMYQAGKTWEYQNQSTGISNFQTKYFLEAEHIVIPSDDVLDAFVKQVSPMMDMIHSNENIELAKLRDTLLPKLLSGEIELGSED